MSKPQKRVTLNDLAQELGLSDRAVSQALNPRASNVKLSPKTIERVRELATLRNYRRDIRARSMRYGRFYSIGYFEAKRSETAWPLLGAESGVFDAADDHDYQIALIRFPVNIESEPKSIPTVLREANLDALILSHAGNLNKNFTKVIDASGFPVIYLNEKKEQNAVYVDEVAGAQEITHHLIGNGYQRIGYYSEAPLKVAPPLSAHYSSADRLAGYRKAMRSHHLTPKTLEVTNPENGQALKDWLIAEKIEALACYNDLTALHVFRYLYDTPLKIPRDLALTGFGDDFARDCCLVGLTTMRIPFYEMGRTAVEMALQLINERRASIPSRVFKQELIVRESSHRPLR